MTKLDREIVLQTLKGYEAVNRITAEERRNRLEKMTQKEAQAIFEDLCSNASRLSREDETRLFSFRHAHRLKLRQAMANLAQYFNHDATV
ncbi:MAG: hypothetical protein Fur0022_40640 [Anaerolineales bacterium]